MNDLVWAIKNGEIDQVRDYFENRVDIDVNMEINGRYPIHYAADYGQDEVLGYLMRRGANVNAKDKHGISPLLAAIWEGHTDCVKLLIEHGADKSGKAPDGTTYINSAEKAEIKNLLE